MDQEACPLSGEDLAIRLTEFGALFSRALSRERVGERAQFRFSKADEHVLRDLTRREKECCSFWSFDIRADNGDLVLDVGVESPRFAHFVDQFYALGD